MSVTEIKLHLFDLTWNSDTALIVTFRNSITDALQPGTKYSHYLF